MQYKYAKEQVDYSDLSSGRVFYSLPGHPAFPVRLASEIFQRCLASREAIHHRSNPCVLYDPCCGAAYHLSVLAYLHGEKIREVIGSDIDEKAVALAQRNFGLLSINGMDQRIGEIAGMYEQYGRDSHKEALASAHVLRSRIATITRDHSLHTRAFQADATDRHAIARNIQSRSVDIVFTDVPYGQHSRWEGINAREGPDPVGSMLTALTDILSTSSIVALVADKKQKVSHESYQRLEHFQVGKRRVVILKPI